MHTRILSIAQANAARAMRHAKTERGKRYIRQYLAGVREAVLGIHPTATNARGPHEQGFQFAGERDGRAWAKAQLKNAMRKDNWSYVVR